MRANRTADSLSEQLEQHAITQQVAAEMGPLSDEIRRLRKIISDLLKALKMAESRFADLAVIIHSDGSYDNAGFMERSAERLREAIFKAEGTKP